MDVQFSRKDIKNRILFNISNEYLSNVLSTLVEEGVIEKSGAGKGTKYKLK